MQTLSSYRNSNIKSKVKHLSQEHDAEVTEMTPKIFNNKKFATQA